MSGQKGQNGPHYLKCSQCKKERDSNGYAKKGLLMRTGETKEVKTRRGIRAVAHKLWCQICGHLGWYTHRHAKDSPVYVPR